MSIKNKEKIHLIKSGRYLCIRACKPTKEKSTRITKKVTCKNCIRILKKKGGKNGRTK